MSSPCAPSLDKKLVLVLMTRSGLFVPMGARFSGDSRVPRAGLGQLLGQAGGCRCVGLGVKGSPSVSQYWGDPACPGWGSGAGLWLLEEGLLVPGAGIRC